MRRRRRRRRRWSRIVDTTGGVGLGVCVDDDSCVSSFVVVKLSPPPPPPPHSRREHVHTRHVEHVVALDEPQRVLLPLRLWGDDSDVDSLVDAEDEGPDGEGVRVVGERGGGSWGSWGEWGCRCCCRCGVVVVVVVVYVVVVVDTAGDVAYRRPRHSRVVRRLRLRCVRCCVRLCVTWWSLLSLWRGGGGKVGRRRTAGRIGDEEGGVLRHRRRR